MKRVLDDEHKVKYDEQLTEAEARRALGSDARAHSARSSPVRMTNPEIDADDSLLASRSRPTNDVLDSHSPTPFQDADTRSPRIPENVRVVYGAIQRRDTLWSSGT